MDYIIMASRMSRIYIALLICSITVYCCAVVSTDGVRFYSASTEIRKSCDFPGNLTNYFHCGAYYSCSQNSWILHYCPYPLLFSDKEHSCVNFTQTTCDGRLFEPKTPCGYRQPGCQQISHSCVCEFHDQIDYGFCLDKNDGSFPVHQEYLRPFYVTCIRGRTFFASCSRKYDVFDGKRQQCNSIFNASSHQNFTLAENGPPHRTSPDNQHQLFPGKRPTEKYYWSRNTEMGLTNEEKLDKSLTRNFSQTTNIRSTAFFDVSSSYILAPVATSLHLLRPNGILPLVKVTHTNTLISSSVLNDYQQFFTLSSEFRYATPTKVHTFVDPPMTSIFSYIHDSVGWLDYLKEESSGYFFPGSVIRFDRFSEDFTSTSSKSQSRLFSVSTPCHTQPSVFFSHKHTHTQTYFMQSSLIPSMNIEILSSNHNLFPFSNPDTNSDRGFYKHTNLEVRISSVRSMIKSNTIQTTYSENHLLKPIVGQESPSQHIVHDFFTNEHVYSNTYIQKFPKIISFIHGGRIQTDLGYHSHTHNVLISSGNSLIFPSTDATETHFQETLQHSDIKLHSNQNSIEEISKIESTNSFLGQNINNVKPSTENPNSSTQIGQLVMKTQSTQFEERTLAESRTTEVRSANVGIVNSIPDSSLRLSSVELRHSFTPDIITTSSPYPSSRTISEFPAIYPSSSLFSRKEGVECGTFRPCGDGVSSPLPLLSAVTQAKVYTAYSYDALQTRRSTQDQTILDNTNTTTNIDSKSTVQSHNLQYTVSNSKSYLIDSEVRILNTKKISDSELRSIQIISSQNIFKSYNGELFSHSISATSWSSRETVNPRVVNDVSKPTLFSPESVLDGAPEGILTSNDLMTPRLPNYFVQTMLIMESSHIPHSKTLPDHYLISKTNISRAIMHQVFKTEKQVIPTGKKRSTTNDILTPYQGISHLQIRPTAPHIMDTSLAISETYSIGKHSVEMSYPMNYVSDKQAFYSTNTLMIILGSVCGVALLCIIAGFTICQVRKFNIQRETPIA